MKRKLKKYFLLFLAVSVILMIISTTTALPLTNSNKIKEEHNKDFKNQITKSLKTKNVELPIKKFKDLSNDKFNKIESKEKIDELISPSNPLTAKEWFSALIIFLLCIILYIPGLIISIILEYIFWVFLASSFFLSIIGEETAKTIPPEALLFLYVVWGAIALIPTVICLPIVIFYPIIALWAILNNEQIKKVYDSHNFPFLSSI